MADLGFPIGGGADPLGGANLQCIHFPVKTYAKTKEIDPVGGGGRRRCPLDPPMTLRNPHSYEVHGNKCAGLDGLAIEYNKKFWNHFQEVLLGVYEESEIDGKLNNTARQGVLSLLDEPQKDLIYLKNYVLANSHSEWCYKYGSNWLYERQIHS